MITTYVIGAGASKAVWGLPVMANFLAGSNDLLRKLHHAPDSSELARYVKMRFGDFEDTDLEALFTDLHNGIFGVPRSWTGALASFSSTKAELARAELLQLITERLKGIETRTDTTDLSGYSRVFAGISDSDTILTFNYDRGIEMYADTKRASDGSAEIVKCKILSTSGRLLMDPFNPIQRKDIVGMARFLKLHGSVDYFTCPNATCPHRTTLFKTEPHRLADIDLCPVCGARLETLIVPPTLSKSFERFPKLSLLWHIAKKALEAAEKLVLWGFSCPLSDHWFSWLLRSVRVGVQSGTNPLKQIDIVNPEHEKVKCSLAQVLGRDVVGPDQWKCVTGHEDYQA